jgi:putative flippase GtrA
MIAPLPRVPSPPYDAVAVVASPIAVAPPLVVPGATRQPRYERLLILARVLFVGFWANVLDFALLAGCFRLLHIDAMPSRCIALVLSGVLTFVASRSFVFRVGHESVPKQAGRFLVAELVGLGLNLASFRMCAWLAPLSAPELVSFVANGLVFIGFSYPVRRLLVFAAPVGPST